MSRQSVFDMDQNNMYVEFEREQEVEKIRYRCGCLTTLSNLLSENNAVPLSISVNICFPYCIIKSQIFSVFHFRINKCFHTLIVLINFIND